MNGYDRKDAHTAASNLWSCCRYNANNAWNFNGNGICNNNNFYNRFLASALARIYTKKKWSTLRIYTLYIISLAQTRDAARTLCSSRSTAR